MINFTKNEKLIILFFIFTFVLGSTIKITNAKTKLFDTTNRYENFKNIIAENQEIKTVSKKSLTRKININSATKQELELLPRIGPQIANNIITYRTKNGPFKTINELNNVPRIGDKTIKNLQHLITAE